MSTAHHHVRPIPDSSCVSVVDATLTLRSLRGVMIAMLLMLVTWWVSGLSSLLSRPLWMDEVHTWMLVSDPDPVRAVQALADGADFNPPAYFLLARIARLFPESQWPAVLRMLSLGLMLSAVAALYLLVRSETGPLPSMTAVLLFGGQLIIIEQLTEIRFYAAWTAALAWLCVLIRHVRSRGGLKNGGLLPVAGVILLTIFICGCHYFGIVSLLLLAAGLCTQQPAEGTDSRCGRRLAVLLVATGIAVTFSCVPLLAGQRSALSRPTWISPATIVTSLIFLHRTVPWIVLSCLLLLVAGIRRSRGQRLNVAQVFRRCTGIPGTALILLAPSLMIFSWTLQPALVPRYATVGMIGSVPIIACLVSQLPRRLQWLVAGTALLTAISNGSDRTAAWNNFAMAQQQLTADLDELPPDAVVLFEDRTMWFPIVWQRPDLRRRCHLADFDDSQLREDSSLRIVQRDAGRRLSKWYPEYQLLHLARLPELSEFWVVSYRGGSPQDLQYPAGYVVQVSGEDLYHFRKPENCQIFFDAVIPGPSFNTGETRNVTTSPHRGAVVAAVFSPAQPVGGLKTAVMSPALDGHFVRGFSDDEVCKQCQEVPGIRRWSHRG